MKKIIKHAETIHGTDIFIENTRLEFTEDEKKLLIDLIPARKYPKGAVLKFEEIKGQPKKVVEVFLRQAERACNWMVWMKEAPNRQEHRDKIKEMLKSFKQTIRFLRQIYNCQVYIPITGFRDLDVDGFNMFDLLPQILAKASVKRSREAEVNLESIVEILEKYLEPKKRRGSPGSYTVDFAKSIAHAYRECFEIMPTGYFNGPFFKIIEQLIKIIGLDYKDPKRAVTLAVSSVKKEYTNIKQRPPLSLV